MTKKPTYWLSPLGGCDVCTEPFGVVMYDACVHVRPGGIWANVCQTCFTAYGGRLGLGLGQKYVRQPEGRWLCTEGRE